MRIPGVFSYNRGWINGRLSGRGAMIYDDGTFYTGMFLDGERHGQGRFRAADGEVFDGMWQAGVFLDARDHVPVTSTAPPMPSTPLMPAPTPGPAYGGGPGPMPPIAPLPL